MTWWRTDDGKIHWKKVSAVTLLSLLAGVTVIILVNSGLRARKDFIQLHKEPSEFNKREFDASLELSKALVGGISTIATIAGGIVLYLNFVVARRNVQVSEEKQVTERFAKAIEHLGSDKVEVRLGGIYALERIARDSAKDHWTIMEILSAYVRERSPVKPPQSLGANGKRSLVESYLASSEAAASAEEEVDKIAIDIQAALTVIGRREVEQDMLMLLGRIDLSYTNLTPANLEGANLTSANLHGANLSGANLFDANLSGANLFDANLSGANLFDADLFVAGLKRANLEGADLRGVHIRGANLAYANLKGAKNWTDEQLSQAHLCCTTLPEGSQLDPNRDCTKFRLPPPASPSSPPPSAPNPPSSGDIPTLDSPKSGSPDDSLKDTLPSDDNPT